MTAQRKPSSPPDLLHLEIRRLERHDAPPVVRLSDGRLVTVSRVHGAADSRGHARRIEKDRLVHDEDDVAAVGPLLRLHGVPRAAECLHHVSAGVAAERLLLEGMANRRLVAVLRGDGALLLRPRLGKSLVGLVGAAGGKPVPGDVRRPGEEDEADDPLHGSWSNAPGLSAKKMQSDDGSTAAMCR